MSADDWLQEYHLTPHGWIEGTSTSFGHRGKNVERPNEAVETWTEHLTQSSIYSATYSSKKLIWTSPDHTQQQRDAIRAQFKEPSAAMHRGRSEAFKRAGSTRGQPSPKPKPGGLNFGDPPDADSKK